MGQDYNKDNKDRKNFNERNESRKSGAGVSQDKARQEGVDRKDRDQKPGAPRK